MAGLPIKIEVLLCGATNDGRSIPTFGCTLDISLLQIVAAPSLPFRSAEFEPARQRFNNRSLERGGGGARVDSSNTSSAICVPCAAIIETAPDAPL